MATTGIASLDFGAFPGGSDARTVITGQAGIASGSFVEAWLRPDTTADHTPDEHLVESIKVMAGDIVAGTGFTIYGVNTSQLNEPVLPDPFNGAMIQNSATAVTWRAPTSPGKANREGGRGTLIYGVWNVAWVWN